MNDHEKHLFDLRGYIVVKDALTTGQVENLSARLEARRKARGRPGSDRTIFGADAGPARSAPSLLEWGGTHIDLVDLPTIAPYLGTLLGTGYRLDHDYINVVNAEHPSQLHLHGGGQGRADRATWSGRRTAVNASTATTTASSSTACSQSHSSSTTWPRRAAAWRASPVATR